MTKIFQPEMKQGIQGDVCFTRVDELPEGLVPLQPEQGQIIVAHSETGHHHAFDADDEDVTVFEDPNNPLVAYVQVKGPGSDLKHHRSYDTHETVNFTSGLYKVNRQRESSPEGWRQVQD